MFGGEDGLMFCLSIECNPLVISFIYLMSFFRSRYYPIAASRPTMLKLAATFSFAACTFTDWYLSSTFETISSFWDTLCSSTKRVRVMISSWLTTFSRVVASSSPWILSLSRGKGAGLLLVLAVWTLDSDYAVTYVKIVLAEFWGWDVWGLADSFCTWALVKTVEVVFPPCSSINSCWKSLRLLFQIITMPSWPPLVK